MKTHFNDFLNENIKIRNQLIKDILDIQNDINWELHSDYNNDYPKNKEYLTSLSNDELNDIIDLLWELKNSDDKDSTLHGRSE